MTMITTWASRTKKMTRRRMGLWGLCDEDIGVAGACSVGSVGSVCHT
ncbi:hypothetical protein BU14_0021s0008 [Porphyra umbilicalis]|uniref:Uncharacterized protein n=1 Tax=Porphyra umbilicalis TaxID=2786 RepID=A0A1X6PKN8_PORUM|nr:hypothetical protein BU14_0021s0008 [Porphyra umbilicalis]|eukprot:OSX81402.1 hypothetical protein BU14_0021s0008 [Porphyra umbilicalis]